MEPLKENINPESRGILLSEPFGKCEVQLVGLGIG
jgi:hypothetical protein